LKPWVTFPWKNWVEPLGIFGLVNGTDSSNRPNLLLNAAKLGEEKKAVPVVTAVGAVGAVGEVGAVPAESDDDDVAGGKLYTLVRTL
tara:strand:+ start:1299 stop:1559 length:261 start_codon:yes stop_codon:yes gene_type:complete